jgi:hypothetical protein
VLIFFGALLLFQLDQNPFLKREKMQTFKNQSAAHFLFLKAGCHIAECETAQLAS